MTDAQLDRMVERYYDRLLDNYMAEDDRKCSNCRYYYNGICDLLADEDEDAERDNSDFCEAHEYREKEEPDWMEDG